MAGAPRTLAGRATPAALKTGPSELVVGVRKDHLLAALADGDLLQPVEIAIGEDGLLASEVLDDALRGAAAFADALDQIEIAVAVVCFSHTNMRNWQRVPTKMSS